MTEFKIRVNNLELRSVEEDPDELAKIFYLREKPAIPMLSDVAEDEVCIGIFRMDGNREFALQIDTTGLTDDDIVDNDMFQKVVNVLLNMVEQFLLSKTEKLIWESQPDDIANDGEDDEEYESDPN
jgi:hypothetical protein